MFIFFRGRPDGLTDPEIRSTFSASILTFNAGDAAMAIAEEMVERIKQARERGTDGDRGVILFYQTALALLVSERDSVGVPGSGQASALFLRDLELKLQEWVEISPMLQGNSTVRQEFQAELGAFSRLVESFQKD